ncbi:hypothetical protein [Streptomyces sp. t39]|uniref:hypothetical protein n=1 Tax=Streptomyces sp. t39 TaxID=1828156 RepID=UPI0011CE06C5|nr:hypothetical protein [Streptomyces sp. t39]TXS39701.1 hypothetical protein EAO77_36150 [Streptomyces sp. t39]
MSELFGLKVGDAGAIGLVVIVVLLILTGRLVPRSTVEDVRADRDARLAELTSERDTWRDAHKESEVARQVAQGQVGELLELSRTADHLLRSLPQPDWEVGDGAMDETSP